MEMPEYGEETTPSSNLEYLRALRRSNESLATAEPIPSLSAITMPGAGSNTGSSPSTDKRRHPRYKCEGSVEFRTESIDVRTWATVTDISSSGCYVEMQATSQVGTHVDMVIEVNGIRARGKGVVRTSYPLLGMGIAFTEIADADQARLEDIVLRLSGGNSHSELKPISSPAASAVPDLLMITDPAAALSAVAKFFQGNRALSREEFTELLTQSQERDRQARR
jgi:PilZ domain